MIQRSQLICYVVIIVIISSCVKKNEPEYSSLVEIPFNQIFMLPDTDHLHRPGFRLGYGSDERFKGSFDEWPSGLGQLYSAGHLMVAGAAYYRATGKRNLLNISVKMVDCIYREFPPGKPFDYIDHSGLGLIKLYEVTGEERYLELAEHIVHNDNHARPVDLGKQENRKPIEEQRKAWGHAVCINYLYSGATDLCRYLNEPETRIALDSLWYSIVDRRIYIHGGVTVLNGIAINSENEPVQFTAIPYYAWQNRGIHEMTVWMYQDINQINDDKTQNIKDQQNPNETIKELTR